MSNVLVLLDMHSHTAELRDSQGRPLILGFALNRALYPLIGCKLLQELLWLDSLALIQVLLLKALIVEYPLVLHLLAKLQGC